MNGTVEATNKNVKKIIAKATETYKDWHEKLPFTLHAYRTGVRTSTGATPYSLVYEMKVVLPIEVEIPSLRVLKEVELKEAEWVQARYEQLVLKKIPQNRQVLHGKWSPNWEGPYVVKKAFLRRALILTEMDGEEFSGPINADIVKKYYAWDHQKKDLSEFKTRKGDFGKKIKKKKKV